ncbi:MAG: MBL fold metallo-hydrolase [Halobacteriota archaeon]
MMLEVIKSEGLAHNSYVLSDSGEAAIIDPRRDCSIYVQYAERRCLRVVHILETHCNEDYVVGSLDLQKQTGAKVAHSAATDFKYGDNSLKEGDGLYIGNLKINVLETPGHTNDSLSYVVFERLHGEVPLMVFTGDALFAGDVGRTDLLGADTTHTQSEKLFVSITRKLLPLGDHVMVYPAHGMGSICGHKMSSRDISTIGYEREANPLLRLNKKQFVRYLVTQELPLPPYFQRVRELNVSGPPPAHQKISELELDAFREIVKGRDVVTIDTRDPSAFAGSHIPDSLSIWLGGMSVFPGWVLAYEKPLLLVSESQADAQMACTYLSRLGFDNVKGYLCGGIRRWQERGLPFAQVKTCSVDQLKKAVDAGDVNVLDVREPSEWEKEHIKGAKNIFVGYLNQQLNKIPTDMPLAVHCTWGGRATLATSILLKNGYTNVYDVLGAIRAWKARSYPLEREQAG